MRRWGLVVGRRYVQRIDVLHGVRDFSELFTIRALRLHPLTGDRKGQFALTLEGRWRVIVTQGERPDVVRVEEVTQHYGD